MKWVAFRGLKFPYDPFNESVLLLTGKLFDCRGSYIRKKTQIKNSKAHRFENQQGESNYRNLNANYIFRFSLYFCGFCSVF